MSAASPGRLSRIAAAEARGRSHPHVDSSAVVAVESLGSIRSAHCRARVRTCSNWFSVSRSQHFVIMHEAASRTLPDASASARARSSAIRAVLRWRVWTMSDPVSWSTRERSSGSVPDEGHGRHAQCDRELAQRLGSRVLPLSLLKLADERQRERRHPGQARAGLSRVVCVRRAPCHRRCVSRPWVTRLCAGCSSAAGCCLCGVSVSAARCSSPAWLLLCIHRPWGGDGPGSGYITRYRLRTSSSACQRPISRMPRMSDSSARCTGLVTALSSCWLTEVISHTRLTRVRR